MAGSLHYLKLMQREHLADSDIQSLSWAAQGVLTNLRCHHWEKGSLPLDEAKMLKLIGGHPKEARKVWEEIRPLLTEHGGALVYLPDIEQRDDTMGKVEKNKNRKGPSAGGRPRGDVDGTRTEPGRNQMVPSDGTGTEHIPETELETKEVLTRLEEGAGEGEAKFRKFFDWFKKTYPRRGPNGIYKWPDTERGLRSAIAAGHTMGEIGRGLMAYKPVAEASKDANTDYVPTPSKWLKESGWLDEYPVVLKAIDGGKAPLKSAGEMRAEMKERIRLADGGR